MNRMMAMVVALIAFALFYLFLVDVTHAGAFPSASGGAAAPAYRSAVLS